MRRRVAVTREEGSDGPLSSALWRRGLEPVPCPVISHAPPLERSALRRAARGLERYHWLVVASTRGLANLLAARRGRSLPPALRAAAVGRRTAEALAKAGAAMPIVTGSGGSVDLLEQLRGADDWAGRCVLIPRAAAGSIIIEEGLRDQGAYVDEVIAYRTIAHPPAVVACTWLLARPDAVVIASPSAARALVEAVGADSLARLRAVIALGATTGVTLERFGIPASIPSVPDLEAAAELCAARLA
jgi:uroporphyrinogen-III synthase